MNNAVTIIYFTADWINENPEDWDLCQINYDNFQNDLVYEIKERLIQ